MVRLKLMLCPTRLVSEIAWDSVSQCAAERLTPVELLPLAAGDVSGRKSLIITGSDGSERKPRSMLNALTGACI